MKKYLLVALFILPIFIISFISLNVSAQSNTSSATPSPTDTVNCFDYYTFQSVKVNLSASSRNMVSGMEADFFGDIVNENPYPLVNGTLYIKVMRSTGSEKNINGPDVVDQFKAMENINIPANGSVPASFKWQIPAYTQTGNYRIVTYFTTDNKFNLSGLSFTDDVTGNSFDFSIKGEDTGVYFDKSKVTINNEQFYFAASPPRIDKDAEGNIKTTVKNTTKETQQAEITWKIYKWDAMDPSNLIKTDKQTITINPNSETDLSIQVTDTNYPVYYIVGELTNRNTKSVVGIRFVREGVDRVRLNFPSITTYPLSKDQPNTMFTCLHNSGQSDLVANNKVVMDLLDDRGKVIDTYTYEGSVTGAMMGLKKDFTPKKDLTNFTLHTKLYTNNELVDESKVEYKCEDLDPTLCQEKSTPIVTIVISIIVLIVLIIILVFVKKKTKGIGVVLVALTLISTLWLFGGKDISPRAVGQTSPPPDSSVGGTASWAETIEGYFYFGTEAQNTWDGIKPDGTTDTRHHALQNPNIIVNYYANVTDPSTGGEIINGSTVQNGDTLRFQIPSHQYTDISWNATGFDYDTPFGNWTTNLDQYENEPRVCDENDYFGSWDLIFSVNQYKIKTYFPFVVQIPNKTIDFSEENLDCTDLYGHQNEDLWKSCTVNGTGTITVNFNFSETDGSFYHRQKSIVLPIPDLIISDPSSYFEQIDINEATTPCESKKEALGLYSFDGSNLDLQYDQYRFQIPPQTITYTFTIQNATSSTNLPPNPPTITGVATTTEGITNPYSFWAEDNPVKDVNGNDVYDQIKYEIDWDADDEIDQVNQTLPSTNFVDSGTSLPTNKSFVSLPHTFKARTVDKQGATSDWTQHTVNDEINPASNLTASCSASLSTVAPGDSVTFTASASGGTEPYLYKWKDDSINSTYSYTIPPSTNATSYVASVTVTDAEGKEDPATCLVYIRNCGTANGQTFNSLSGISPNLCSNSSVEGSSFVLNSNTWSWKCTYGPYWSKYCSATKNNGGTPPGNNQPPNVTLIIQPRLAPNCIARFVDGNNQTVSLTGTQTCTLSGPQFVKPNGISNPITFNEDNNSTNTPITTPGLYTLSCGANADSLVVIDSDICIGEGDSIQN